ncbi:uncharacterized protein LOC120634120 [Pararge aegeria]|uniref:Jg11505 protein n=2 Tax=Pararge aegeria TaxID=116150 RepID=A0A8S4RN14_9NEOP|nr:uncharacterized protein LOC120634120 [Pararge aegeria]XP_039760457.1 uncharacterized protein LOC120634120 [Pararge aegeria]XP_039760466.1 uncharacterized protein LOC120634120 [Pararge aegeria]XP_039760475.1 uncharacterized protein LOC120634120 [Pararge aegeria]CAH2238225.1 jg11505 [Pararge aegeria aegeria]
MGRRYKFEVFAVLATVAVVAQLASAQPPLADDSIGRDKAIRQSLIRAGKNVATKPKWGFFGTVFNLILEQINDTKSAYNQVSDLVNNQFVDDNAVTVMPDSSTNGTTETPKITRTEFLRILDRNLKGLARLRSLEWREARKDSWSNAQGYWSEVFAGKKSRRRK